MRYSMGEERRTALRNYAAGEVQGQNIMGKLFYGIFIAGIIVTIVTSLMRAIQNFKNGRKK